MQCTGDQKTDDKAADGETRIKRATSRRTAFMCSTYSLMAVELEAMTPIIMKLQAGESAGRASRAPIRA